ncbi:MAG: 6-bladed beta-propeller [Desulfococcaceae bacterium]
MKTVSRKRSYALVSFVSCVLFLISLPVSAFSQEEYVFERMWPALQQPWYFKWPRGVAVDRFGNVYVADTNNHRIQKFGMDGTFITKWGSKGAGAGQFNRPEGICADPDGNVYVADAANHRVQKFSPDGVFVTTWGSYGSGDGQFRYPNRITADQSGSVYVADYYTDRIQKFSPDGIFISVSYGSGELLFRSARDQSGNIYVADTYDQCINKFSPDGTFITKWGSEGYGKGQFVHPNGITADPSGNVFVADSYNNHIQKFGSDGTFIAKWGRYGSGDGQFRYPSGITIDPSGNLYVADTENHRIQKFGPDGTFITKWGSKGDGDGQFSYPRGISADPGGNIYVKDTANHRIQKFSTDGTFITKWGSKGDGDGQFSFPELSLSADPSGITTDPGGNVYVADSGNDRIQKFGTNGNFIAKWGSTGSGDGQFSFPRGITSDLSGNVYVAERYNHRIQKFGTDGTFITKFGKFGSDPGMLNEPLQLYVNAQRVVYISDNENNRIQVFKPLEPPARKNKAIIVAGGGPYPGNNLWDATRMCANFAYRALTYQGYTKDTIYYISHDFSKLDLDSNGIMDDVDADAANASLEYAVKTWGADAQDLFIYMVDHGGAGTFVMREFQLLKASDLDAWLDSVQAVIPGKIVLLYDACRSGSFLSQITPPTGKERVVASSSGPDQASVFAAGGSVSFSFTFWGHMFNGESFYTSYVRASQAMALSWSQTALIDANGNGTENETEDINLAQTVKIGNETLFAGDIPRIEKVSPSQTLEGETSALLYAENVIDADGISHVWAVITPPDYSSGSSENPVSDLPVCDLLPVSDSRYEALCKGFTAEGTYNIAVYARDGLSVMGLPKQTEVIQAKGIVKGDIDGTDSLTTLADAVIALKVLADTDTSGLIRSDYAASKVDVNGDNAVGMEEAVYILRKVAGL